MFKTIFNITITPLFFVAAISSQAYASGDMELKTSYEDVQGVRDIEAGNYQLGIKKLHSLLAHTKIRELTAPAHTNLCVAYIALGESDSAQPYCNQAIAQHTSMRDSSIAYSNRAVLHYVQGKTDLSLQDIEVANELNPANRSALRNLTLLQERTQVASNIN